MRRVEAGGAELSVKSGLGGSSSISPNSVKESESELSAGVFGAGVTFSVVRGDIRESWSWRSTVMQSKTGKLTFSSPSLCQTRRSVGVGLPLGPITCS